MSVVPAGRFDYSDERIATWTSTSTCLPEHSALGHFCKERWGRSSTHPTCPENPETIVLRLTAALSLCVCLHVCTCVLARA